jgi:hypothetical protein
MTATFPDISNKVMSLSPLLIRLMRRFVFIQLSSVRILRQPDVGAASRQFAGGCDF